MSWRYELAACADDCSGAAPAPPVGMLGTQRIAYVSGDAAHFRFRHASGWVTRMDKTSANSMRGALPGGEVNYPIVCTRSMTPRDAARAPF